MVRKGWGVAALVLVLAPSAAYGDWLFTPTVGYPFGGDTLGRKHAAWGGAIGWLDPEGFGIEADIGVAPRFFDGNKADFSGSGNLITLMGNVLITGPPDARVMPYATGGAGYLRMNVTSDAGTFESTTHEAGFNLGAGIVAWLSPMVGVRGDLRYLRSFQDQPPSWTRGVEVDIAPGAFDFWRGSIGVTVRVPD